MVPYIPAKCYKGSMMGYVFKTDTQGLGYYLDKVLVKSLWVLSGEDGDIKNFVQFALLKLDE